MSGGAKIKPEEIFPSLAALRRNNIKPEAKLTDSLKQSALFSRMQTAKGGDTLPFLQEEI
jgi:hypothetical protein